MAFHLGDMLRPGSTNFTSTETNLTSLKINGTSRAGYWVTALYGVTGGTNQVSTLHQTSLPTGGTYTVTIGGVASPVINWNDANAVIQAKILATANIVLNNIVYFGPLRSDAVVVTGGGASGFGTADVVLTFGGPLANQPITVTLQSGALTGGGGYAVQNTTAGVGPTCAITFQVSDDNATWVTPPVYGTLYLPPGLNQPMHPVSIETPRKYLSATLTYGGTGTFTKLQVAAAPDLEGFN
jgi:hypothetical protein